MSLMLDFLYDDVRSMADNLVLCFFVKNLEHPIDVSDVFT
jgi:hypothetical protein